MYQIRDNMVDAIQRLYTYIQFAFDVYSKLIILLHIVAFILSYYMEDFWLDANYNPINKISILKNH